MYRAQPWTMRQIAGFGTADDTNERFRFLIAQGQTGISTDFDMPTLMGYDSDDERSEGEVGREGVAIDSVDDMLDLYAGIDLEKISVSMTINPSAWILLAMYLVVADERGFDRKKLSGTIQNDIIKEYIAQKEWVYPPRPAMRIVRDTITYSAQHLPRYNPVNVSGYHTREAGEHRDPGGRLHAGGRDRVRRGGRQGRDRRRRLRAAALVLLRLADRLLRGGREVPGRAPRVGARDEGAFRREEAGVDAAALPLPDRRRVVHRARAAQQHRAHRDRGAGRGAAAARSRCTRTATTRRSRFRASRR